MEFVHDLPHLQAVLNTVTALLLVAGHYFIRRKNRAAHRACMTAALAVSAAFLASYLVYHSRVGYVPFAGQGFIRPVYFTVLGTHVLLAILILPFILVAVAFALKGNLSRHRRIVRWALPVWLYVSVSGVFVYLLNYHVYSG